MIDPNLKSRLMEALEHSVAGVNSGESAVDSLYKAADAQDFNIEQTRRLCEMFNTAKTLYHYSANPDKRAAAFEVVDPDTVIESLFARVNRDKKLAFAPSDLDIADEYLAPAERDFVQSGSVTEFDKSLLEEDWDTPSIEEQAGRVQRKVAADMRDIEHARNEADIAEFSATEKLSDLVHRVKIAFDRGQTGDYEYLMRNGKRTELLQQMVPDYMAAHSTPKLAFHSTVEDNPRAYKWSCELEEIGGLLEKAAALRAMAIATANDINKFAACNMTEMFGDTTEKEPDEFEGMFKRAASAAQYGPGFSGKEAANGEGGKGKGGKQEEGWLPATVSSVGDVPIDAAKELSSPISGVHDKYLQRGMESLLMGDHQQKDRDDLKDFFNSQEQSIILEEFINADPVLSTMDPNDVANAYLTLVQIAPEAARNKGIARSMLRQMAHSDAFSAYDAKMVADLESTIGKIKGTVQGATKSKAAKAEE